MVVMSIRSKKDLELVLSKLKGFTQSSLMLEQYSTPSDIAAEWIWNMALKGEAAGKFILDAACGQGILGLGLLLMGAKKVFFVDKDPLAMQMSMENYNSIKEEYEISSAEFVLTDISQFSHPVDIVVQNPPFGTKLKHADRAFLVKAFEIAPLIYSMHKYSTESFVTAMARDHDFKITEAWRFEFPIKAAFKFHEKPVRFIDVGLWRLEKIKF